MTENHLKNFVVELAEYLRYDSDIKIDRTLETLASFRSQLEAIYIKYEGTPPDGSEEMYLAVRASTLEFYRALEDLELFIEDPEDALLDSAVKAARDGSEVLEYALELAEGHSEFSSIYA